MHRRLRTLLTGLLLLLPLQAALLAPPSAGAETSAQAREWLDKMAAATEQGFELDMAVEKGAAADAQAPMSMSNLHGHMVRTDRRHMRVEMSMDMQNPQTGAPMTVKILAVLDGETMWNEMDTGMGKQVTKMSLATMAQGGPGMSSIDPISQVEDLAGMMDFEVASSSDSEVVLEGTPTGEGQVNLAGAMLPSNEKVLLVLDPGTGFPRRMVFGADQPFATMTFENVKVVDPGSLDAGLFSYTPAEGVPVIDVEETLRMQRQMQKQQDP